MKKQKKPFSIRIRWGIGDERFPDPEDTCLYEFDTEPELNAFLLGVDESSQWLDYDILEDEK